jgi:FG-GAP-like repeat
MRALLLSLTLPLLGLAGSQSPDHRGQFSEMTIRVGKGPKWISVADVNHDGHPDIVVANADSGTVTVLLGDGKGQFHAAAGSPFAAGHLPNDIAIADMNGDGNLDLVIANHQSPFMTILLGDGKGGFCPAPGSPVDVHSTPHPHGVAVADFNQDGFADVVTDSWGTDQVELLPGDGKGGLHTPGRYFATGHRPYERLRSADFNKDGFPDIVTTDLDDDTVTALLGDGRGGFRKAAGSPFSAGAKPWQVAVDDVNGDGRPDLLIIPYERDIHDPSQNAVTVLLGDGNGAFRPMAGSPLRLGGCHGADSVTAGDLLGDGRRDIVVACAESKNLTIFARDSDGQFLPFTRAFKGGWGSVAFGHLRDNCHGELITANNDDGTITILFAN